MTRDMIVVDHTIHDQDKTGLLLDGHLFTFQGYASLVLYFIHRKVYFLSLFYEIINLIFIASLKIMMTLYGQWSLDWVKPRQ